MLPQLQGLRVEASGALVGVGAVPLPHGLDVLAAVRVQEQHHRVVLDVVQPFHGSGSDVQERVLVLGERVTRMHVYVDIGLHRIRLGLIRGCSPSLRFSSRCPV